MPSPFLKDEKPSKPDKPGKPESSKEKPFSLPAIPLEFMPPAANHPNRLVAVTGADGEVIALAFSDSIEWRTLVLEGSLPLPVTPTDPAPGPIDPATS